MKEPAKLSEAELQAAYAAYNSAVARNAREEQQCEPFEEAFAVLVEMRTSQLQARIEELEDQLDDIVQAAMERGEHEE